MSSGPQGPMAAPQPHADQAPPPDPLWEGDKMFNIYIYDYCTKRGFNKTAKELLVEAEIPPDSAPPIDAKQGLLFEWWSVFWVLFTAKNNGSGTDDAMVYTQHQLQQANMKQLRQPQTITRLINGNPAQMQNGTQGPMPFALPQTGPHPNGIPISTGGPAPAGANPTQPQNFNPLVAGQRPGGPQHRGPNGINPYQSPTMAHSPQNPGSNPGPNPQHMQPSISQLGSSPHFPPQMSGQARMIPPGSNLGAVPSAQAPFSQHGRSPSRPNTPGGQGMVQPSPSLVPRQPPAPSEAMLNNELKTIPLPMLNSMKQEVGLADKDLNSLTQRLVEYRRGASLTQVGRKPNPGPGPAGPSNPGQAIQMQGQRPPGQPSQQPQMSQQLPPQQPRVVKRNSTTPPEEGPLPNSESSPPERKRVRRSSVSMDQPPGVSPYPHQQPQPQGGAGPQPMPNGPHMMRGAPMGGGPMTNFPPHGPAGMGSNPGMGLQMGGGPPMGGAMAPGMGSQPGNMMMGVNQMPFRPGMHMMPKNMQGAMGAQMGGGGTPAPGDPGFNPGPPQPGAFPGPQNSRIPPNKPTNMMPPPSPAGGSSKEQPKDGNKPPGAPNGASHPDGSPHNQPPNPPQPGGQGPPPPSTSNTQGNTAPPTPSATSSSITAPSPSAVNGTPTINPATQPTPTSSAEIPANFLTAEFMQSVANLDDFEFLRQDDAGINFEQDFGQWFNPGPEEMDGMRGD
ncbi:hypothetical protein ID866_3095 [Astraeus odoratus]|nr:hypothetical protein ID866_3095 [Astraeus odoratus]